MFRTANLAYTQIPTEQITAEMTSIALNPDNLSAGNQQMSGNVAKLIKATPSSLITPEKIKELVEARKLKGRDLPEEHQETFSKAYLDRRQRIADKSHKPLTLQFYKMPANALTEELILQHMNDPGNWLYSIPLKLRTPAVVAAYLNKPTTRLQDIPAEQRTDEIVDHD
jgi:hypothetical protein